MSLVRVGFHRMFLNLFFGVVGDLEGLKVSHDFDEMDDGESRILTLKDSRLLDNEGTVSCCYGYCFTL